PRISFIQWHGIEISRYPQYIS
ncbi:putative ATP-binding component of a transport system, partial [Escherichia coli EC1736]